MNDAQCRALIQQHEGLRLTVYRDTAGVLTIGYGYNLENTFAEQDCIAIGIDYQATLNGAAITLQQATALFEPSYQRAISDSSRSVQEFDKLPDDAAAVLVDLAYNLGYHRLQQFQHFLAALDDGNWPMAAGALRQSLWCQQVNSRCIDDMRLLQLLQTPPTGEKL